MHHNICRRRTLVAIGTHDLDTIKAPFRYAALKPEEINFIPLAQVPAYVWIAVGCSVWGGVVQTSTHTQAPARVE